MKTGYPRQQVMGNFQLLHSNIASHPNPQMCIKLKIESNLQKPPTFLQIRYFENKKIFGVNDFFRSIVGTKA